MTSFAWRARVAVEVRYGWLCVVGVSGANAPVNAQPHQKIAAMLGRPGHSTVGARAVSALPGSAMLESMPQPPNSGVQRIGVQSLAMVGQDKQAITSPGGDKQPASLPIPSESFEPSVSPAPEGKNQEVIWVVVIRGATVHSEPSVSAPTARFYSIGTELQLIDYQHGWFQVLDPVTSQRGWIYEKYYLEAIRGPAQMVASLQEPAKPQQEVVNARKPTPHVRRAKNLGPRPIKRT